jgi:hypothetical protein
MQQIQQRMPNTSEWFVGPRQILETTYRVKGKVKVLVKLLESQLVSWMLL